ncbi:hypothetical protein SLA2020_086360 [Shorea laevis]
MLQRDVFSRNSSLDASAKNGDLIMACKLFDAMPERSIVSCNIMIVDYLKGGNPECALKLFKTMAKMNLDFQFSNRFLCMFSWFWKEKTQSYLGSELIARI